MADMVWSVQLTGWYRKLEMRESDLSFVHALGVAALRRRCFQLPLALNAPKKSSPLWAALIQKLTVLVDPPQFTSTARGRG